MTSLLFDLSFYLQSLHIFHYRIEYILVVTGKDNIIATHKHGK